MLCAMRKKRSFFFFLPNKEKDGVAVKGRGDHKVMKWLHRGVAQPAWHFPQFCGFIVVLWRRCFNYWNKRLVFSVASAEGCYFCVLKKKQLTSLIDQLFTLSSVKPPVNLKWEAPTHTLNTLPPKLHKLIHRSTEPLWWERPQFTGAVWPCCHAFTTGRDLSERSECKKGQLDILQPSTYTHTHMHPRLGDPILGEIEVVVLCQSVVCHRTSYCSNW